MRRQGRKLDFTDAGVAVFPELMAELEAIRLGRIGGLCHDWANRCPWPTWPKPDEPDFRQLSRRNRFVPPGARRASFRHGDFTEAGDTEPVDREIMAHGRQKWVKAPAMWVKRKRAMSPQQRQSGTRLEPSRRTMGDQNRRLCPANSSLLVQTSRQEGCKCLKTLERVKGIEPSYSAWKAAALPLSYTRVPTFP